MNPQCCYYEEQYLRRLSRHVDSSPTPMIGALNCFYKGAVVLRRRLTLALEEDRALPAVNVATTRRNPQKRKRVQKKGSLAVEDGLRLATLKESGASSYGKRAKMMAR